MQYSRRRFTLLPPLLAALLSAMAPVDRAMAHAIVIASDPAPGATLPGPDVTIALRYNSRIDAARSRIDLKAPDGRVIPLLLLDAEQDTLKGRIGGLVAGSYAILWKALSVDGHLTRGTIIFFVAPSTP